MISIPRSRLIEIGYILRVTLNNSIYVDVPIELINFLSVDPPPMPSDARRRPARVPVATPATMAKADIASTMPVAPAAVAASAVQQSVVQPPHETAVMAPPRPERPPQGLGITGHPTGDNLGYTTEQLKGEPQGTQQAARSSSTTLDIEALLAQGRARAAEENANLLKPTDGTQDFMPRPISPGSRYSSVANTIVPESVLSTMRDRTQPRKISETHSEADSIDDEERNRLAVEAHRRDGRAKSLAVISTEDLSLSPSANHSPELRDDVSVIQSALEADEMRTYKPAEEPSGTALEFDNVSDEGHDGTSSPYERSVNPDPDAQVGRPLPEPVETLASSEDDHTPTANRTPTADRTPVTTPLTTPREHPIAKFLHHISEEEEPLTDDMLDDMVSLDETNGRGLHYLNSTDEDEDDDLVAEDGADTTPRVSTAYEGRPSLDERLAMACGGGAVVSTAKTAVVAEAREFSPNPNKGGFSPVVPETKEFGARPKSVDYAEPLEIDDLTLTSMASMNISEPDDGYDAMSEQSSIASRGTNRMARHKATHSLPFGWTPYASEAPSLPPPSSARDISWGGNLAGRTVSGRTAMISLEDDPPAPSPRSATFGTKDYSPRMDDPPQVPVAGSSTTCGESTVTDDEELRPPSALRRVDTGGLSFHTAQSDSEEVPPPLKRSSDSESSSDNSLESPPTVSQPVYTTPLPVPPGPPSQHRTSLTIPDRFRPHQNHPPPAMSEESHMSTASSSHESAILPAVKARVAQFESREDALRRFTVASSAGLHSPTMSMTPLSPVHTSSGSSASHSGHSYAGYASSHGHGSNVSSPSKRRSYTAALAPRVPGGFSSPRSQTSFNFDTPQTATGEFAQRNTAGPGTPTSSISSVRRTWEIREENELSGSASKLLSRALSNSSVSTTATDVERALSSGTGPTPRSPVLTPRGPRPPSRKAAVTPTLVSAKFQEQQPEHDTNRDSGSTLSMTSSDLNPPDPINPTYRGSPALTPTRKQAFLPDVMSETASLEDIGSLNSHRSHQSEQSQQSGKSQPWSTDEERSSGSEFGNMHWTGGAGLRLPPLRQPAPMPAFGPNGPRATGTWEREGMGRLPVVGKDVLR